MPSKSNPEISERKELEFVSGKIGKPAGLLSKETPLPEEAEYLLEWFFEISPSETLTYLEVQAWAHLTGRDLKPYESKALIMLDREHRSAQNRYYRKAGKN